MKEIQHLMQHKWRWWNVMVLNIEGTNQYQKIMLVPVSPTGQVSWGSINPAIWTNELMNWMNRGIYAIGGFTRASLCAWSAAHQLSSFTDWSFHVGILRAATGSSVRGLFPRARKGIKVVSTLAVCLFSHYKSLASSFLVTSFSFI